MLKRRAKNVCIIAFNVQLPQFASNVKMILTHNLNFNYWEMCVHVLIIMNMMKQIKFVFKLILVLENGGCLLQNVLMIVLLHIMVILAMVKFA